MGTGKLKFSLNDVKNIHVYILLAVISILSRLPFLGTFELVAFDGTYYLNQARTIFSSHMAGAFPIGYPLVVRAFQLALRDYQTAGMAVSFAASVGSVIVVYLLAIRFVRRELALLAAVAVALNPLLVRFSLMTMSESVYIFWVLLGFLMYTTKKWLPFGLAMGMAVITRPEALAIVGLLGLSRIRYPRQAAIIAASFLAVYGLNVAVLSANSGKLVLVSKSSLFGSVAENWRFREATVGFEGEEEIMDKMSADFQPVSVWDSYISRMPLVLRMIVKNVWPVVFVLALFAFLPIRRRRYLFLLAGLVPFAINPLFTPRSEERFILPYLPLLILLAVFAIDEIKKRQLRRLAIVLVVVTIVSLPVVNRAALLEPEERYLVNSKMAAIKFREWVEPGDKIAGRKPYFAFYSGGDYVEIPLAPYEDVIKYLVREDVKFVELHQATIHPFRPPLRPLIYSSSVINGELRYRQTYFDPTGEMVLERTGVEDPLRWLRMTSLDKNDFMPAWSPDGKRIAYRSTTGGEAGGIYVIAFGDTVPRKIADATPVDDGLSWSPDGRRIAFSNGDDGQLGIYTVDVETGAVTLIVGGEGSNVSPSWAPNGNEIIYSSDRSGQWEIWACNVASAAQHQVTKTGGNEHPSVSPSGNMIAWIRRDEGVVVLDGLNRRVTTLGSPSRVRFAPAWSADERYIAVTANDWGSMDIYIITVDGTKALLLTKNQKRDVMPAWSPNGRSIALASDLGSRNASIWVIGGLAPYLERLESNYDIRVFSPPK
jgi:hypothetical protein